MFACAQCHGDRGVGGVSPDVPALQSIAPNLTVAQLTSIIEHGAGVSTNPTRPFMPGVSPVPVSGKVFDASEMTHLVDSSLDFYLTASRFTEEFEAGFAEYLGLSDALFVNSGSSANLLAVSALSSPRLGKRRLLAGDEVITAAAGFPTTVAPIIQNGFVPVFIDNDPAYFRPSGKIGLEVESTGAYFTRNIWLKRM